MMERLKGYELCQIEIYRWATLPTALREIAEEQREDQGFISTFKDFSKGCLIIVSTWMRGKGPKTICYTFAVIRPTPESVMAFTRELASMDLDLEMVLEENSIMTNDGKVCGKCLYSCTNVERKDKKNIWCWEPNKKRKTRERPPETKACNRFRPR